MVREKTAEGFAECDAANKLSEQFFEGKKTFIINYISDLTFQFCLLSVHVLRRFNC